MKRLLSILITMFILGPLSLPASAGSPAAVTCREQGFSLQIPEGKSAVWRENDGFVVSVGHPGYVPYIAVYRRVNRFNNPVNYLNNIYREFMENSYGDRVGTNPCRTVEIGGKTVYSAVYHYEAGGNRLALTFLIEPRADGDVEYRAKYAENDSGETLSLLETLVRSYQPAESAAAKPKATVWPIVYTDLIMHSPNGRYWAKIRDTDRIMNGGYFSASLFTEDEYDAASIEALQPGDQVQVAGRMYTVSSLKDHGDGKLELMPQEDFDGYIVFERAENSSQYTVLVNDWKAVSFLEDYRVMMPLPNDFAFGWLSGDEDAAVYDAEQFVNLVAEGDAAPEMNQYNTMVYFQNDLLMMILHSDYPAGPEEE